MKTPLPIARILAAVATAILTFSLVHPAGADQIVNGGFETGSFSGWTVNDPSGFTNIGPNPLFAESGTYHANLGAKGLLGTLSQNVGTTMGQSYQLSFWLTSDSDVPPNEFDVFWNGVEILNLVNLPAQDYTHYSFTVSATSNMTPLVFQYRNDDDFFRLDDVALSVPETSSTLGLLLLSVTGLAVFPAARKRQK